MSKMQRIRLANKAALFSDVASYAITAGPVVDALRKAPAAAAESAAHLIGCLLQKRQTHFQFYDASSQTDYWVWIASDGLNLVQIQGVRYETSQIMRALFAWEKRDEDGPWYTDDSFLLTQDIACFLEKLYVHYQQT
jgi:hypothetical protein